ncbi:hypothetical protein D3C78_1721070 [compost metagenome]
MACSTTGWRPASISMSAFSERSGAIQSWRRACSPNAASVSSSVSAAAQSDKGRTCSASTSSNCSNSHFSRANERSCADKTLSSQVLSSGVM